MPNPVWPVSLNTAVLVENSMTFSAIALRTEMDIGPAKVRKRISSASRFYDASVILRTDAELTTFNNFFITSCEGGAQKFDWKEPINGVAATLRFVGEPNIQNLGGGIRRADFRLEKTP